MTEAPREDGRAEQPSAVTPPRPLLLTSLQSLDLADATSLACDIDDLDCVLPAADIAVSAVERDA